uniref:non-specific serine/threonine protein kinase n=1 Tax=Megaselia scalaris TaxID=36166 RepID=T1GAW9_MEGSC
MEEELNFYIQNAKIKDIKNYMKSKGIQKLGIPHYISNGIFEKDGKSYKFIILPRFGKSIGHFINYEYRAFLPQTIYRLTLQILDALEYIHKRNYIHGDLKADNILLGYGSKSKSHINIVDFGTSLPVSNNFLESPDSTSFGTWTYNARDTGKVKRSPAFDSDKENINPRSKKRKHETNLLNESKLPTKILKVG